MPLIDNLITRYENGVINRSVGSIFASMGQLDPTKFHTYFEDFDYFLAADWTTTVVGAGTSQITTDLDGGAHAIQNSAADDDSVFLNKIGEGFLFELGKRVFFKARFSHNDPIESDSIMGLQITDTTPLAVSDGVFFRSNDASAAVELVAVKNGAEVVVPTGVTLVAGTLTDLAFFWDGIDRIWFAEGDNPLGILTPGVSLPDDETLTISFGVQNGEAVFKTMTTDYIFAAKER